MQKNKWDSNQIPNLKDKVVIITGATSGLGKEAARVLAGKDATVVMAVRNTNKAESVSKEIKKEFPNANIDIRQLELNSLKSIQTFSDSIIMDYERLHVLINNAGVMACPFSKTEDGFEIQMGVNHLGHFALTGLLLPLMKITKGSRIVVTSSIAHKFGNINFEDINWEKRKYNTSNAYGDSKIANLYFTYELAKKLKGDANAPLVTAAHPGWTSTELQRHSLLFRMLNPLFSQNVRMGTLPTLRAAFDENAKSGDYFGPSGFQELKGYPKVVSSNKLSKNEANAKKLWDISEQLTGIKY